jgi:hypothetical protein
VVASFYLFIVARPNHTHLCPFAHNRHDNCMTAEEEVLHGNRLPNPFLPSIERQYVYVD